MTLARMWKHGQLTIPKGIRKEMELEDLEVLTVVKAGKSILLTPKRLEGDILAAKAEASLRKRKLSLDDVLKDLASERRTYNKEKYGR